VEKKDEHVKVSVQVENISDRDGKEVVQLYVSEVNPTVYRPIRELKSFEKVLIKAHEKKKVVFELAEDAFSYYSETLNKWIVNQENFMIEIRKNAHEIILAERVKLGE
jgi:beta-glucosidase